MKPWSGEYLISRYEIIRKISLKVRSEPTDEVFIAENAA
jgi:hypothetical protein